MSGSGCSSSPAPTPSTADPMRSSATSWLSACSASHEKPETEKRVDVTATRPEQPTPEYVPAHGLLKDKVVVVTAAAGAGIGASVTRRALEEGAKAVVLSDTHERRVAEAHEALAAEFGAERVLSTTCDVTDESQVQALLDLADTVGGVDVMINNAGLG